MATSASAGLFRVPPLAIQGSDDASGKSCDAPGARDHSFEVFRRPSNARNRASSARRRLDGARHVEAFRGRRAELALAGRHERRRPGGGALRHSRDQTGSSPARRAGLADGSSGAERKHVTLVIVWDEYIAANPGGYSYSRFCELYRGFESKYMRM